MAYATIKIDAAAVPAGHAGCDGKSFFVTRWSKQRLSGWTCEGVRLAYTGQGLAPPLGFRAHSTWGVAFDGSTQGRFGGGRLRGWVMVFPQPCCSSLHF